MAGIQLYDYQKKAIWQMKNGCILCGGVGSGKSITALSYYYLQQGGEETFLDGGDYIPMGDPPKDLYIITTARKRDTCEWEGELSHFLLSPNPDVNLYMNRVVIDSWNNIAKLSEIQGAFFIFDEQRVVGSGSWVKAFLKIAKANQWILLSATPGIHGRIIFQFSSQMVFIKIRRNFSGNTSYTAGFANFPKWIAI